ncbi:MAG: TMEM143 family protein [Elainellaceae cyanobacterium]
MSAANAAIPHRDAFIPCRRRDLIDLCLKSGKLDDAASQQFREFCALLSALYHFRFHRVSETIKQSYAPFDPNVDVPLFSMGDSEVGDLDKMRSELIDQVRHLLERANYNELSQGSLRRSLEAKSLIELRTEVDFDDFDQILCYYRGDASTTVTTGRWFWKRERQVELFERVVLLIHFKDAAYFETRDANRDAALRRFIPGRAYVYFYKHIPKHDVELLFPNVKTKMTWKDIAMLSLPALVAGASIVIKVLPQLLIVLSAIMLAIGLPEVLDYFNTSRGEVVDLMPVLIAVGSLCVALGGFAYKQYSSYKTKKLTFQKNVTDTLFFRNLANNAAVFQLLIDLAEEEECKEVILVYYHLLTSQSALTPARLDQKIEAWMTAHLKASVNFDVADATRKLAELAADIPKSSVEKASESGDDYWRSPPGGNKPVLKEHCALLQYDEQGRCQLLPLGEALMVLDQLWDDAFRYAL